MPLNIVTDSDIAAVPYDKAHDYVFQLNSNTKGPHAAMIPMSLLQDAERKEECISRLAEQFQHIPYSNMLDNCAHYSAQHYIPEAMLSTYQTVLTEEASVPYLKALMEGKHPGWLQDAVQSYATQHRLKDAAAVANHYNAATPDVTGKSYNFLKNMHLVHSPELHPIKIPDVYAEGMPQTFAHEAYMAEFEKAAHLFGKDAPAMLEIVDSMPTASLESRIQLRDSIIKFTSNCSPAEKEAIVTYAQELQASHKLPAPTRGYKGLFKNMLESGEIPIVTPDEIQHARELTQNPIEAAKQHYNVLKSKAAHQASPLLPAGQFTTEVEKILEECPAHIRAVAEARGMRMVIANNSTELRDIMPGRLGGILLGEVGGGSTSHGIYFHANALKDKGTLAEELIHEVERMIVQGEEHAGFSLGTAWMKAITHDTTPINQTAAFKDLTKKGMSVSKGNYTISSSMQALNPADTADAELTRFVESVPDVYHYEAVVQKEIATRGSITLGGQRYKTVNEAMHAAFPSGWSMLEGPAKGMQLVQDTGGKVIPIAENATLSEGTTKVTSLVEHCEQLLGKERGHFLEATQARHAKIPMNVKPEEIKLPGAFKRFMQDEKWVGKKGVAFGAAAVAIGAVTYAAMRSKHKPHEQSFHGQVRESQNSAQMSR